MAVSVPTHRETNGREAPRHKQTSADLSRDVRTKPDPSLSGSTPRRVKTPCFRTPIEMSARHNSRPCERNPQQVCCLLASGSY